MSDTSSLLSSSIQTKKSNSIFLQITEQEDGTITRPTVPIIPPSIDDNSPVLTKDLPLNPIHNTKLRLYLPNPNPSYKLSKLPILVYYHGGGFVLLSPDFVLYHQFCHNMSLAVGALVVSLGYRLSPENRLPAAYDDAVDAIRWVGETSDPWIVEHGDLDRVFVTGSSSGGNMAFFACIRAVNLELGLPKIKGLVMIQPYFGGESRTESEKELEEDEILPLRANDMMWRMALPVGANRDHEYCNLEKAVGKEAVLLPRSLVMGVRGDPLFDRHKMFVEKLKEEGAEVVGTFWEEEGGIHGIELVDADWEVLEKGIEVHSFPDRLGSDWLARSMLCLDPDSSTATSLARIMLWLGLAAPQKLPQSNETSTRSTDQSSCFTTRSWLLQRFYGAV